MTKLWRAIRYSLDKLSFLSSFFPSVHMISENALIKNGRVYPMMVGYSMEAKVI